MSAASASAIGLYFLNFQFHWSWRSIMSVLSMKLTPVRIGSKARRPSGDSSRTQIARENLSGRQDSCEQQRTGPDPGRNGRRERNPGPAYSRTVAPLRPHVLAAELLRSSANLDRK